MSTLGPEARMLVDAGREALRPSVADRARVLEGLQARIVGQGLTQAGAPQAIAGKGLAWLAIAAGAALGLGIVGGLLLLSQHQSTGGVPTPEIRVSVAVAPRAAVDARVEPSAPSAASASYESTRVPAETRGSTPRPANGLAEEVAILSRAETELHAGRYAAALAAIDEHRRKFPRGTLAQERVAVRIHALCGLGRVKEAEAEFRALNRLSPKSPHEGRAREVCAAGRAK